MNAITNLHACPDFPTDHLFRYSTAVFRGTLKAREGEQRFGRLKLDAQTAYDLGTNNIGLFVERCSSFERMIDHFQSLRGGNATWVIVASSKRVEDELLRLAEQNPLPQNVLVSTPEQLRGLTSSIENLAGVFVFDYACHIHKCRGNAFSRFRPANDRPQKIVDFRLAYRAGEWSPPLVFFTNRRAISVNTIPMLSPYCLETFRYIDGQTIRFGEIRTAANDLQVSLA